jgi:hypothetical protein
MEENLIASTNTSDAVRGLTPICSYSSGALLQIMRGGGGRERVHVVCKWDVCVLCVGVCLNA